jgi:protein-S-isoprenylcysteine O-methyltransferase Ste14
MSGGRAGLASTAVVSGTRLGDSAGRGSAALSPRNRFVRSSSTVKLLDHIPQSGDWLFRWRGQLPLLMLPLFLLGLFDARLPAELPRSVRVWQFASLAIALTGLAVRIVAVGTAPAGTSERSTTNPRASELRTTGLYSIVRHPLYLGNTLTAVGFACFTTVWYLPVIVALLGVLYHERIAAREEVFLEGRFGEEFVRWADQVPAMIPRPSHYLPSTTRFRWQRVIGREYHGVFVIGSVLFVLDLTRSALATGRLVFDPFWSALFVLTAAIFVVCSLLKKATRLPKIDPW